jgi:hypothetical protein
MTRSDFFHALAAAAFGCALTFSSTAVPAQDADPNDPNAPGNVDMECVEACHNAARDCMFDGREAFNLCLEEAACDDLSDAYRAACLAADRDDAACAAARSAFRDCVEPCREDAHAIADACREARTTCLTEGCGLDDVRPPRGGHGAPGEGHRPPHGPRGGRPSGRN